MEACEYVKVHEGIKGENPRGFTNVRKQNLSHTHTKPQIQEKDI